MLGILNIVIPFLEAFLANHGQNLPAEILKSVQAAYQALSQHRGDLITKANLDSLRG